MTDGPYISGDDLERARLSSKISAVDGLDWDPTIRRRSLESVLAQLLMDGHVTDTKEFARGLIAPQIRQLELMQKDSMTDINGGWEAYCEGKAAPDAELVAKLWALVDEMIDAYDDGYGMYTESAEWARSLAALLPPRADSTPSEPKSTI